MPSTFTFNPVGTAKFLVHPLVIRVGNTAEEMGSSCSRKTCFIYFILSYVTSEPSNSQSRQGHQLDMTVADMMFKSALLQSCGMGRGACSDKEQRWHMNGTFCLLAAYLPAPSPLMWFAFFQLGSSTRSKLGALGNRVWGALPCCGIPAPYMQRQTASYSYSNRHQ